MNGRVVLRWGGAAAGVMVGCTQPGERERFESIDAEIRLEATIPTSGATEVDGHGQIDFCFSGLLDPRSIDDFDTLVSSGQIVFDTEQSLQLFAWRPPGEASGVVSQPWCDGSVLSVAPKGGLPGGVLYRVRLGPTPSGWAGETLDTQTDGWNYASDGSLSYSLEFEVREDMPGDGDGDGDGDDLTLTELFEDGAVFDPARDACGCHRDPDDLAVALLDLRTVDDAYTDLVLDQSLRSTGFPLVAPRKPAESFLVHKLLRDADGNAIHQVFGEPMPPDEPLPHVDMGAIAVWIADGATK